MVADPKIVNCQLKKFAQGSVKTQDPQASGKN